MHAIRENEFSVLRWRSEKPIKCSIVESAKNTVKSANMIFHVRTLHMQLLYQQGSASIALFQYIFHFLFLTLLDYISLAFAGMFRCNPEALVRRNHKPFPVETKQIHAMQTNFSLFSWPWHKIHCELYLYINLGHQPQFPYFHTKMQSLNFHCIFDAGCNARFEW